jgi:Tfp pilus assembly protein PilX
MKRMKAHLVPQDAQGSRDSGVVLVVGLMFIMVLAAIGSVAYLTTSGDLLISRNYRQHVEAGFVAESALQEAKARLALDSGDTFSISTNVPAGNDPRDWSVYIASGSFTTSDDPDFNNAYTNDLLTSAQSNAQYLVRIRYKRERDAELLGHTAANTHYADNDGTASTAPGSVKPLNAPGNVIHFNNSGQFTTGPGVNPNAAVYLITAFARSGADGPLVSREIEVARLPGGDIDVLGAFYNEADMTFGKGKVWINSVDGSGPSTGAPATRGRGLWCPNPSPNTIPALYTHGAYSQSGAAATIEAPAGQQPIVEFGTEDLQLLALFNSWVPKATVVDPNNIPNQLGDENNYGVWLVNGDFVTNGGSGYGVLLVTGDLITGGNFYFNGIVIVLGTLRMQGTSRIYGAVMSLSEADDANMGGTPGIFYNSCDVQAALDALGPDSYAMLAWRDLSLMED